MLKQRIIELVSTVPAESTVYADAKPATRVATPPTAEELMINRRAHALLDPAFPWHFARAFVLLRQALPAVVCEPNIKLAYEHLLNRAANEDITEAQIVQHPSWATKRGFLEALLLLPDLRLDEVAAYVGLPVSVVQVYENLFWCVRDRMDDQLFVNAICYPETRQVEYRPDYFNTEEPRNLMLRAAFHNDLQTVLGIFGTRMPHEHQSSEVSAKKVKARIMADADFVVRAGGASSKVQVLDAARRMIVAAERYAVPTQGLGGDDFIGLTALGLNPGQSILDTVKGLMSNTAYNEQLSLQSLGEPGKN